MTLQDSQAIQLLMESLTALREDNRIGHEELKLALRESRDELKHQFCSKFDSVAKRVDKIELLCAARKLECAAELAERKLTFEAEIAKAQQDAVLKATQPSVYKQATQGLIRFALRALAVIASITAIVVATLVILEKLHMF